MKARVRVFVKRNRLRQCPNVAPIPFSNWPVTAKIVGQNRFDTNLHESRDDILVQIRMAADDQPRNTGFLAGRANAKIVQTRLGVCSGGRDLRQGQQTPLPVAKFHQVSRGRSGLQCQRTCDRGKQVALSSCLLASDKFLSTDMTCHEHYHRQKDTYAHTPPCRAQTENESGLSG